MTTTAVTVARAALIEAGRPDLAARVNENKAGWPTMAHTDGEHEIVVRAFWLGHISTGHRAAIERDPLDDDMPGIFCDDCWESYR
jgi:hypothetical protein